MPNVKSFEDFLSIYNAYQLYMASQGEPKPEPKPDPKPEPKPDPKPEPKPEPKPDPKPDDTPAWAQSLLDRMDKLEKRQPGVSIESIKPVGLEDVIKKML